MHIASLVIIKFDESPFYLWSSCKCLLHGYYIIVLIFFIIVMDPHIPYMALREEFTNDKDLAHHLEVSKERLQTHC